MSVRCLCVSFPRAIVSAQQVSRTLRITALCGCACAVVWLPLTLLSSFCLPTCAAQRVMRDHPEYSLVGFADGSFFLGEVNDRSEQHGQGVSFYPDGSLFTELLIDSADVSNSGHWIDGKLNGRATRWWNDGSRYVGSFKNDLSDGLGVYSWKDGRCIEGEFASGKRSGLGACWDKDGELKLCGLWSEDVFVENRLVPLRCLPEKRYLSGAGQSFSTTHTHTRGRSVRFWCLARLVSD